MPFPILVCSKHDLMSASSRMKGCDFDIFARRPVSFCRLNDFIGCWQVEGFDDLFHVVCLLVCVVCCVLCAQMAKSKAPKVRMRRTARISPVMVNVCFITMRTYSVVCCAVK